MAVKSNKNCEFCENVTEDLTHAFLSCPSVIDIQIKVEKWINIYIDHRLKL